MEHFPSPATETHDVPASSLGTTQVNSPPGPRIISWNVTRRCPLKCAHCYIDAGAEDAPGVLTTSEACGVIDQIRESGPAVVILSGGEPLMREDIFEIARYGTRRGLRMAMGTSGFLFSPVTAPFLAAAGIRKVAVSVDSADPAVHDAFRGRRGSWDQAVRALRWCGRAGIGLQINTTVRDCSLAHLDDLVRLGTTLGVRDYQLFFTVPGGRARTPEPGPQLASEAFIHQVLTRYPPADVNIRPTCVPQFRRIAREHGIGDRAWGRGCIAGIRYCRICPDGEVTPCPYLPVSAGNVRTARFTTIWNTSEIFAALRDPARLTGKCGRCRYTGICGGCRARAYAQGRVVHDGCGGLVQPADPEGDLLGPDPSCTYEPEGATR